MNGLDAFHIIFYHFTSSSLPNEIPYGNDSIFPQEKEGKGKYPICIKQPIKIQSSGIYLHKLFYLRQCHTHKAPFLLEFRYGFILTEGKGKGMK